MSYRDVLADAEAHFARVASEQPAQLQCGNGCNLCCYGLFEIAPADVAVVVEAVKALPAAKRAVLIARAEQVITETAHPDIRAMAPQAKEAWFEAVRAVPCPALDSTGLCSIYASRPMICRTFGLPIRERERYIGDICDLNFRDATQEEKERAAWDIDVEEAVGEDEQYTIPEAIMLAARLRGR